MSRIWMVEPEDMLATVERDEQRVALFQHRAGRRGNALLVPRYQQ